MKKNKTVEITLLGNEEKNSIIALDVNGEYYKRKVGEELNYFLARVTKEHYGKTRLNIYSYFAEEKYENIYSQKHSDYMLSKNKSKKAKSDSKRENSVTKRPKIYKLKLNNGNFSLSEYGGVYGNGALLMSSIYMYATQENNVFKDIVCDEIIGYDPDGFNSLVENMRSEFSSVDRRCEILNQIKSRINRRLTCYSYDIASYPEVKSFLDQLRSDQMLIESYKRAVEDSKHQKKAIDLYNEALQYKLDSEEKDELIVNDVLDFLHTKKL